MKGLVKPCAIIIVTSAFSSICNTQSRITLDEIGEYRTRNPRPVLKTESLQDPVLYP